MSFRIKLAYFIESPLSLRLRMIRSGGIKGRLRAKGEGKLDIDFPAKKKEHKTRGGPHTNSVPQIRSYVFIRRPARPLDSMEVNYKWLCGGLTSALVAGLYLYNDVGESLYNS